MIFRLIQIYYKNIAIDFYFGIITNSAMKTIDYSYFIERYIAGEMDQTEKIWFEKELSADISLQKEVQLRKKADRILERQDIISLRNKLSSIEKVRTLKKAGSNKWMAPRYRYAAVITGLLVLGSLLFTNPRMNPDEVIDKYMVPYEYQENSRSAESTFLEAIDFFNNGDYGKALEGFESYLVNNPGSMKITFLSGVANMERKNYEKAETWFNSVIENKNNLYVEDASYYLAWCYIKTKKISKAEELLRAIVTSGGEKYRNSAKSALRKL